MGTGAVVALGVERALPDHGRPFHLGPVSGPVGTSVVWRGAATDQRLALTLDDGPDPEWTPRILSTLQRHDARATFFLVGSRAAAEPSLVQRQVAEGHEIANHTYTHADLVAVSREQVREELGRTQELVERLTGTASGAVRPPWGRIDSVGLTTVAEMGCPLVLWSNCIRADHADADLTATVRDIEPGGIVLAHDGGRTPTPHLLATLERFVAEMTERGWTFVPVSELLPT